MAPTPSGPLHLGNALAFTACWLSARASGARVLLRVEDVDRSRARRHLEDQQKTELEWLGLTWDAETAPQRERDYLPWLERLAHRYFCTCTRRTIAEGGGRHPLSCRETGATSGAVRFALEERSIGFCDRVRGARVVRPLDFGDPVLRRRDGVFTYNLAVVADDIADGVTEVVRGADLLDYTAVQIALWEAFGATPPTWMHTPIVLGPDGRKLSKSHGALGLSALRDSGVPASGVRRVLLRWLGLAGDDFDHAIPAFSADRIPAVAIRLDEDWRQTHSLR